MTRSSTIGSANALDEEIADPWRWAVLMAFSLNAFANAFLFMDFNVVPDVTKVLFGYCEEGGDCDDVGDSFVLMTYAASLFAVLPSFVVVLKYINSHNWITSTVGLGFQFLGAWGRYISCELAHAGNSEEGRIVAITSSVFIGFGAAIIISSYSLISSRWFPTEERTYATTLPVMANYAGWCLGCVVIPYTIETTRDMRAVQLYQGIACSVIYLCHIIFHRERPKVAFGELSEIEHHEYSMIAEIRKLFSNRQYILQCFCYSILAGVSFAVPGFGTSALKNLDLSEKQSAWVNFAFVLSGVITGTVIGKVVDGPKRFPVVLRTLFLITSLSFGLVIFLLLDKKLSKETEYPILIVAMAISGAASLGFIGIALSAVIETTHPIDPEYSGGVVEWFVQLWGGAFTFAASAPGVDATFPFWMVAIPTWLCTILMFTLYDQEYRKSELNNAAGLLDDP